MADFLRPQSVGDILTNTFSIYGRGFIAICLTYFLPLFPVTLWQTETRVAGAMGLYWLGFLVSIFASLFAFGAITVAVSDLVLGNRPSVARSYGRVFSGSMFMRLFGASLLQALFIGVGFILLVIPGLIAVMWLLFTPAVVVLEGLGGMNALKRSKALGQGFNWRNVGVFLLMIVIGGVFGGIVGGLFGFLFPGSLGTFAHRLLLSAIQLLTGPVSLIAIVLMYYDLRVRKEAYDAAALAEDLRR